MTTSSYTPAATGAGDVAAPGLRLPRGRLRSLVDGIVQRTESVGNSRAVQVSLDLAAVGFIALVFVGTSLPADFLFHCAFVILVVHAFLFGLPGTLVRIGLVSIPLVLYADGAAFGLDVPPFELAEWPLMFVIALLVAWMAERRNSTSRRYAALFRQASERLLIVEEAERRRIAAELHDGVGQVLTALTLNLDAAQPHAGSAVIRERLAASRNLAGQALAGTRELAHRMRPARLEERGLVAAIRDLASQSGFPVTVDVDPSADLATRLDANATVEVYRIVQESLANAARHSGAALARVTIAAGDNRLLVMITDNGRGFDQSAATDVGIGLSGMRERARLVAGQLSIESAPDAGTQITVSVPLGNPVHSRP